MNIAYITKQLPFGSAEAFIYPEIADHEANGVQILVVPVERKDLVHNAGRALLDRTIAKRLVDADILIAFLVEFASRPGAVVRALSATIDLRRPKLIPRNAAVWLKGVWLARELSKRGVDHIHAHWIAVPATMGLIASRLSGIPLSITAHRYDIAQGNLIAEKFRSAAFVRAIDRPGATELTARLKAGDKRPLILHMGVDLPVESALPREKVLGRLHAVIGARLVEKKGHAHLLDAVAEARAGGLNVELDVFGSGPLEPTLRQKAETLGISDLVNFKGDLSHDELLAKLRSGAYDVAVLPSISTVSGDKEGIPVFLMEAMAAGLPVVATPNGGIAELITAGSGILVPEGDAPALAGALRRIADDEALRLSISRCARERIAHDFAVAKSGQQLRALFSSSQKI